MSHVDENDTNEDATDAISITEIITQERKQQELYNSQEVYLMKAGKKIFKATYNINSETTTSHGKRIEKGEERFFITKELKDARVWKRV